jgi:Mg2+ and Co2+ transporter CorA
MQAMPCAARLSHGSLAAAASKRASTCARAPALGKPRWTDGPRATHGRLKKRLAEVSTSVSGCRDAFEQVQEDEVMALMYLTALQADPAIFDARLRARSWNTDEVELLLDSYEQEMASMTRQLKGMEQEIDATEALLKLKLDTARNNLIKVDVSFGIAALWLTACSLVSGYYGMNLVNGHENDTDLVGGSLGPSTIWLEVVVISSGGASALIASTLLTLWCCGLFQS